MIWPTGIVKTLVLLFSVRYESPGAGVLFPVLLRYSQHVSSLQAKLQSCMGEMNVER